MDGTLVVKKEPLFIKTEPVSFEVSSAVPDMIPNTDDVKDLEFGEEIMTENIPNISMEIPVPVIKNEIRSSSSEAQVTSNIETFEEQINESLPKGNQKVESGIESFPSNEGKSLSYVMAEEPASDCQQNNEGGIRSPRIHSLPHDGGESLRSTCKEVAAEDRRIEMDTPFDNQNSYSCNMCQKVFAKRKNLERHQLFHTAVRPFECDICGSSFKAKFNLQRHKEVHNKGQTISKPFTCDNCSKSFRSYKGMLTHKLIHKKVSKPCCCDELNIPCTHITGINDQQNSLNSILPFCCSECGKKFGNKWALIRHTVYHSNDRPYICNECNQGFKCRKDLVYHSAIHTNVKSYSCSKCGKKFRGKSCLNRHMLTHSDERPYSCNDCSQSFKCRKTLINHLVIHNDDKPFACNVCDYSAKRMMELNLHMTKHSDEEPYGCNTCGLTFKNRRYLNGHKKSHDSNLGVF